MSNPTTPTFLYGTAWKEERTEDLVFQALKSGFRALDTANQRKHYFEEAVGLGLHRFMSTQGLKRDEVFLQTKFTFARGQDHRKPYDENESFQKQVQSSFKSSLEHLKTDYLDSYLLHGPYLNNGLHAADLETWSAMEDLYHTKKVKHLGVSNFSAAQLQEFCGKVRVKPTFVQNRCYAQKKWDEEVRQVCKTQNLTYQGFSLLTANTQELSSPIVAQIANKYKKTVPQVVFRFCNQLGMICLTGTSSSDHMKSDLNIFDFELNNSEIEALLHF